METTSSGCAHERRFRVQQQHRGLRTQRDHLPGGQVSLALVLGYPLSEPNPYICLAGYPWGYL